MDCRTCDKYQERLAIMEADEIEDAERLAKLDVCWGCAFFQGMDQENLVFSRAI